MPGRFCVSFLSLGWVFLATLSVASTPPAIPAFVPSMGAGPPRPVRKLNEAPPIRVKPVQDGALAPTIMDGTWVEEFPGAAAPSAREVPIAIYDPVRDRMVIFGGYHSGALGDVWALSLAGSPEWAPITPAGTPPSPKFFTAAIYDPVRDRVVIFGGYDNAYHLNGDVWALSLGGSPEWTQLNPGGDPPSPRIGQAGIYDPVRDRMVVFGGWDGSYLNDVWALSLGSSPEWTQLSPSLDSPIDRGLPTAIYDPVRDRMVIFGGKYDDDTGIEHPLSDVWALWFGESLVWTEITPAPGPSARLLHTAIYDPARDRMVVFGGAEGSWPYSYFDDVWALSLSGNPAWTQLTPAGTPPSPRGYHASIYDPMRDRMVAFGGWDGSDLNEVWSLLWGVSVGILPQQMNDRVRLAPAYPNPSRSNIAIGFTVPRASASTLRIYDVSGRLVKTLVDGALTAGPHVVRWDRRFDSGVPAPSGSYVYELRTGSERLARKVVVIN